MRSNEFITEAIKQRLDPKCWKGKHKEGTKIKGGVRVNNCVPNESVELSLDEQFDIIEEMVEQLAEAHGVNSELIWEDFESVDDRELLETAAWQRSSGKNKNGGLNAKGIASYRRENPGSKLQMAVTTKPSKLKSGSKAAKRRKSFCARMGGMKGPTKMDFAAIVGSEVWAQHQSNLERVQSLMRESQALATKINTEVANAYKAL